MKQVVLIDAKNAVYRHAAVNANLSRSDGFPTGALYGCLNSMLAIARRLPDASFVWCWDGDGETWRHKYTRENVLVQASFMANDEHKAKPRKHVRKYGYKATRVHEEESESKYPQEGKARANIQIPVIRLALEGSGIRNYQVPNLEGDDLIAILVRYLLENEKCEVIIHSGDRDFYQLLKNKRVKILSRMQEGKLLYVTPEEVKQKYKVSVRNWVKYRAWTGDASDNIPHLRNVGPSVAQKMLAAGLDPSLKYSEISEEAKQEFARFFEPHGIEATWPFVEQNYKLCKLVSRPDDDRLPEKMREKVKDMLDDIHFTRDKHRVNAESYRRISHLMMSYELRSILAQRSVLWNIP